MAKAKARGIPPGLAALRKRYKANLTKLTEITPGKTEYETNIRAYRHEVSKAKKAGLLSKSIDARKALPTPNLTRLLERAEAVISGRARAQTVTKKEAARLKDEGYEIIKDKVILAKDTRINKRGELVIGHGQNMAVIAKIKATHNIEKQARDVMEKLRPGQFITLPLPNSNSSIPFSKHQFDEFYAAITRYMFDKDGKEKLKYLYVQRLANRKAAEAWDTTRLEIIQKRKAARKTTRATRRKKAAPGPRKQATGKRKKK